MKIGWIGTGIMGRHMCGRLLEDGNEAVVYSRTREKARDLEAAGARWAGTPADVARQSEVVFTMVGFPPDVEEVYLGSEGLVAAAEPGTILVDMTTSKPSLARRIAETAAQKGLSALDAPVSGGDVGARDGTLSIMVGGEAKALERVMPLFQAMGRTITLMGEPGAGQHTKMANQILISTTLIGMVESLLYASRAGLDQTAVIDLVGKGAAGCWSINTLGPRVVAGDFEPGFYIKHFIKDMGIALEEAERMGLELPGLALAHRFYSEARQQGLGDLGIQGLYKVFEAMNEN